jgi:hypothetical protein
MKTFADSGLRSLLAGLAILLASTAANAQATRTWVSGVGDDANPCSRTAPCKTFAGAISKTATGGVIDVLDPGGFGAVTITKSITIDGGGFPASVLVSGTNGIVINSASAIVVLRNLQFEGMDSGLNAINVIAAKSVYIENCQIEGFKGASANNGNGILVAPTAGTTRIFIDRSTIADNGWGNDGGAVRLRPTGASTFVFLTVTDSRLSNINGYGVLSRDRCFVTIDRTTISGNSRTGVNLLTTGSIGETVVSNSALTDNGFDNSEAGIVSSGATSFVHINGNTISQSATAIRRVSSGHISSSGDNRVPANTATGTTDGSITSL